MGQKFRSEYLVKIVDVALEETHGLGRHNRLIVTARNGWQ